MKVQRGAKKGEAANANQKNKGEEKKEGSDLGRENNASQRKCTTASSSLPCPRKASRAQRILVASIHARHCFPAVLTLQFRAAGRSTGKPKKRGLGRGEVPQSRAQEIMMSSIPTKKGEGILTPPRRQQGKKQFVSEEAQHLVLPPSYPYLLRRPTSRPPLPPRPPRPLLGPLPLAPLLQVLLVPLPLAAAQLPFLCSLPSEAQARRRATEFASLAAHSAVAAARFLLAVDCFAIRRRQADAETPFPLCMRASSASSAAVCSMYSFANSSLPMRPPESRFVE